MTKDRIRLREVVDADLDVLFAHQKEPEGAEMAGFPSRGREAFLAHWQEIRADTSVTTHTILCDDEVVGNIVSWVMEGEREVGYWIGKAHWGKGIATIGLSAFLDIVDERPLFAHVVRHNTGSIRVLEKCGFKRTGEVGEEVVLSLPAS